MRLRLFGGGPDCFFCRMMRSFAFTGLGAALGGFGAIAIGLSRPEAINWALGGGLFVAFLASYRRR